MNINFNIFVCINHVIELFVNIFLAGETSFMES